MADRWHRSLLGLVVVTALSFAIPGLLWLVESGWMGVLVMFALLRVSAHGVELAWRRFGRRLNGGPD